MAHTAQLKDRQYRNWVKAGLGLKYLKEGIETFIDDEVKSLKNAFLSDIRNNLTTGLSSCNQCTVRNVLPCPTYGICNKRSGICTYHDKNDDLQKYKKCPNNICDRIWQKIRDQHRYHSPSWRNTDSKLWCSIHWEIAKCFLPVAGYATKTCASETDCSGLLNIIINCLAIGNKLDCFINSPHDIVSKNITARNDILHSSSLHLTDEEVNDYIDGMITLLQDKKTLAADANAQAAVVKLIQLKEDKLVISTNDEVDIREAALAAIEQTIEAGKAAVKEVKTEAIEAIKTKHTEVIKDIQCQHYDQNKTQEQLKLRQDNIEERMEVLQQEIQPALYTVENLDKGSTSYLSRKQELKDYLIRMYTEHLSTIPVSPVLDEIDARIDDVFVELIICDDLVHEPNILENKRTYGEKVKGYKDILFKLEKKNKSVYIIGDAGIGKTTWCMKLLSTWISAHNKSKDAQDESVDTNILSEFDIVLFVSMRLAAADSDIQDMIRKQLFGKHKHLDKAFTDVIKMEPHKCIIVLDGLDEWSFPKHDSCLFQNPNLPGRNGLYDCTVLTTTRPWKLNSIRLNDKEIDRAVKIQGLADQGLLAERIIDRLNGKILDGREESTDVKTYSEFQSDVQEAFIPSNVYLNILPEFMKIPLILTIMVCLWFDDGKFATTLAANYAGLLEFLIKNAEGNRRSAKKRRLFYVPQLEALKQKWSNSELPICFCSKKSCREYGQLLLKLSRLAFDTLFDLKHQTSLVFEDCALRQYLSEEELDVALQIGVVSQTKFVGKTLSVEASITFLHKTLHEFMAAIHLVSSAKCDNSNTIERYAEYCSSCERVKEMENVLVFVCGMCPQAASMMSKHIAMLANDNLAMENDNSINEKYNYLSKDLPLRFVQEVHANDDTCPSITCPIYRDTMNLDLDNVCSDNALYHIKLLASNIKHLQSLSLHVRHLIGCDTASAGCQRRRQLVLDELHNFKYAECLTSLELHNIQGTFSTLDLPDDLDQVTQLPKLDFSNTKNTSTTNGCQVLDINLSKCHTMRHFTCNNMSSCKFALNAIQLDRVVLKNCKACSVEICPSATVQYHGDKLKSIECKRMEDCSLNILNVVLKMDTLHIGYCKRCIFSVETRTTNQASRTGGACYTSYIDTFGCYRLTDCTVKFDKNVEVHKLSTQEKYLSKRPVFVKPTEIACIRDINCTRISESTFESIVSKSRTLGLINLELSGPCTRMGSTATQTISFHGNECSSNIVCSNVSEKVLETFVESPNKFKPHCTLELNEYCHNMSLTVLEKVGLSGIDGFSCNSTSENTVEAIVSNIHILSKLKSIDLSCPYTHMGSTETQTISINYNEGSSNVECSNVSERVLDALVANAIPHCLLKVQEYCHSMSKAVLENIGQADISHFKCSVKFESTFESIVSNLHTLSNLDRFEISCPYTYMDSTENQTIVFISNDWLPTYGLVCNNMSESALEALVSHLNHFESHGKLVLQEYCHTMSKEVLEKIGVSGISELDCSVKSKSMFESIVWNIHTLSNLNRFEISCPYTHMDSTETQTIVFNGNDRLPTYGLECNNVSERTLTALVAQLNHFKPHGTLVLQEYCHTMSAAVLEKIGLSGINKLECSVKSESTFESIVSNIHTLSNLDTFEISCPYTHMNSTETRTISYDDEQQTYFICNNISESAFAALVAQLNHFKPHGTLVLQEYCHTMSAAVLEKIGLSGINKLECSVKSESTFESILSNIHTLSNLNTFEISCPYTHMDSTETQTISYDEYKHKDEDKIEQQKYLECNNISEQALAALVSHLNHFKPHGTLELQEYCHTMSAAVLEKIGLSGISKLKCSVKSESTFESIVLRLHTLSNLNTFEISCPYTHMDSTETQTIVFNEHRWDSSVLKCNNISERTLEVLVAELNLFKPPVQLVLQEYCHSMSQDVLKQIGILGISELKYSVKSESTFESILSNIHTLSNLNTFQISCPCTHMDSTETQTIVFMKHPWHDRYVLECNNISEQALEALVSRLNHFKPLVTLSLREYCHTMSAAVLEKIGLSGIGKLRCSVKSESTFESIVSNLHTLSKFKNITLSGHNMGSLKKSYLSIPLEGSSNARIIEFHNLSEKTLKALVVGINLLAVISPLYVLRTEEYCHDVSLIEHIASTHVRLLHCTGLSENTFESFVSNIHILSEVEIIELSRLYDNTTTTTRSNRKIKFNRHNYLKCSNISESNFDSLAKTNITQVKTFKLSDYSYNISSTAVDYLPHTNIRHLICKNISEKAMESLILILPSILLLETLELSDYPHNISPTAIPQFTHTNIKHFICKNISENTFGVIMRCLPYQMKLESLELSNISKNNNRTPLDLSVDQSNTNSVPTALHCVTNLEAEIVSGGQSNLKYMKCINLSKTAWETLASTLHLLTQMNKLELSDAEEHVHPLFLQSVQHLSNLKHLCCSSSSNDTSVALAKTLSTLPHLAILELSGVHVSNSQLTPTLPNITSLRHLKVDDLSEDGWKAFVVVLPRLTQLEKLEISHPGPSSPSVMQSLQYFTNLRHLSLLGLLHCPAPEELGDIFLKLTLLETLIIDVGCKVDKISLALRCLKRLRHLDCRHIEPELEWEALTSTLPELAQLEILVLEILFVSSPVQPLQNLTKLKQLSISSIYLDKEQIKALLDRLHTLTQLEILELKCNEDYYHLYAPNFMCSLSLLSLVCLKKVTIENAIMDDTQCQAFIDQLPVTPHVLEVKLRCVSMSWKMVDYIQASRRFPSQQWEYVKKHTNGEFFFSENWHRTYFLWSATLKTA